MRCPSIEQPAVLIRLGVVQEMASPWPLVEIDPTPLSAGCRLFPAIVRLKLAAGVKPAASGTICGIIAADQNV